MQYSLTEAGLLVSRLLQPGLTIAQLHFIVMVTTKPEQPQQAYQHTT